MPDTTSVLNIVLQPYQFCRAALAAHTRSHTECCLEVTVLPRLTPPPPCNVPPFCQAGSPPLGGRKHIQQHRAGLQQGNSVLEP